ncbi:MAG TPA: hypothetical protein VMW42_02910 [Desulfatiglandales bacterium]|nr:hypothetical protein [Desulfatiglandales bacterium]
MNREEIKNAEEVLNGLVDFNNLVLLIGIKYPAFSPLVDRIFNSSTELMAALADQVAANRQMVNALANERLLSCQNNDLTYSEAHR